MITSQAFGRLAALQSTLGPLHAQPQSSDSTTQPAEVRLSTGLLLGCVFASLALAPLAYPGYFQVHSGFTPVWNVTDLRANWSNLSWLPQLGLRFDPLRSAGLLPYYLAALLPVEAVTAVKLVMGLGWLLGGAGMFLWLRSWLGRAGALVASLVYVYLPYQLVTVYVRGAWGETLFWGGLPWGLLIATHRDLKSRPAFLALVTAVWLGLGLSQLGLAIVALLFLGWLALTVYRSSGLLPLAAAGAGLLIAGGLYGLRPVDLIQPPPTPLTDHFLVPFQLFSAHWGFDASRAGWNDDVSFQLGLVAVGLTILTVYLWRREPKTIGRRLRFFLAGAVIIGLLQFEFTAFLWRGLGLLVTYPWQLLGLAGLCLSVLAGAALRFEPRLGRLPLLAAIVILIVLSVYRYLEPQFIQPEPAWFSRPLAELGEAQLALLDYEFAVQTSGHTVGLDRGQTTLPLPVYGALRPNDVVVLKTTWQPLQTFEQDLKIFVHLVDAEGHVLAQFDGQPQAGTHPTSRWVPGHLVNDTYAINLPTEAPPGPYRVYLGLYDEATLTRLPVPGDPEGRVILPVQ